MNNDSLCVNSSSKRVFAPSFKPRENKAELFFKQLENERKILRHIDNIKKLENDNNENLNSISLKLDEFTLEIDNFNQIVNEYSKELIMKNVELDSKIQINKGSNMDFISKNISLKDDITYLTRNFDKIKSDEQIEKIILLNTEEERNKAKALLSEAKVSYLKEIPVFEKRKKMMKEKENVYSDKLKECELNQCKSQQINQEIQEKAIINDKLEITLNSLRNEFYAKKCLEQYLKRILTRNDHHLFSGLEIEKIQNIEKLKELINDQIIHNNNIHEEIQKAENSKDKIFSRNIMMKNNLDRTLNSHNMIKDENLGLHRMIINITQRIDNIYNEIDKTKSDIKAEMKSIEKHQNAEYDGKIIYNESIKKYDNFIDFHNNEIKQIENKIKLLKAKGKCFKTRKEKYLNQSFLARGGLLI